MDTPTKILLRLDTTSGEYVLDFALADGTAQEHDHYHTLREALKNALRAAVKERKIA